MILKSMLGMTTKSCPNVRHTPAIRPTFADFGDDREYLRPVFEDNDFNAWLVLLHPEQRRYAGQSYHGPFRLTSGSTAN